MDGLADAVAEIQEAWLVLDDDNLAKIRGRQQRCKLAVLVLTRRIDISLTNQFDALHVKREEQKWMPDVPGIKFSARDRGKSMNFQWHYMSKMLNLITS